jgi:hypothetical protein
VYAPQWPWMSLDSTFASPFLTEPFDYQRPPEGADGVPLYRRISCQIRPKPAETAGMSLTRRSGPGQKNEPASSRVISRFRGATNESTKGLT